MFVTLSQAQQRRSKLLEATGNMTTPSIIIDDVDEEDDDDKDEERCSYLIALSSIDLIAPCCVTATMMRKLRTNCQLLLYKFPYAL